MTRSFESRAVSDAVRRQFSGRRVYVAGHRGMVGSALSRALAPIDVECIARPSTELDLRDQAATEDFFRAARPEIVLFAAAKVGGIQANIAAPAEFLYDNVAMAANAVHAAHACGVTRFVYVGSACVYPRLAPQPMVESSLLGGDLEPTNEGYAVAKIAGIKLCQNYRRQYGDLFHSIVPTNLYGPGDNYHAEHAHVLPALLRRFHEAKEEARQEVTIWGTGRALREFLYVDDLAAAILHLAAIDNPPDWVNAGSGQEVSILQLAELIAETVGYEGQITTDADRPDGMPRKLTDVTLLRSTGWEPSVLLREGLARTYEDFLQRTEAGLLRTK